ncbi:Tyrosine--tRNA ligase [Acaryochloris thomasi RCC1774]|uniref:Tyrosine--tRNA ligase n=1 Tax=Acaryochloris thomasi RCC1774 TaxID=1764569 RepID=A0A2W1JMY2_9CYAN|nr:tyrosine--tRNA ligase [Acaryochloris thomasi]PZD72262.1 Tyrosine--tRNA ligase [Acaryochloris thomasi RCC1774]
MDAVSSVLSRGVSEIFPNHPSSSDLNENLQLRLQRSDQPLRVKFGIDPTGTDIHLGHSIPIRKLRAFQDLGHTAVLIIGDFTAQIGDPTGKSEVRRQLTESDVQQNVKTYLEQIRPILDFETPGRLEIRYNSEWLTQLDLSKVLQLLTKMTVGQMLAKEGFSERYQQESPIYLHEFLYPLMQGYDSVAVQADIELGGTDQKFNIAVGRDLQRHFNQSPQFGLLMPILLGTDGVQKMSKSLNNYVGLSEDPVSMYSKLEKTPDTVIKQYFELLTNEAIEELPDSPRECQKQLALTVVSQYHNSEVALQTQKSLAAVVTQQDMSQTDLIPEFSLATVEFPAKLFYLVSACGLCASSSEARRQIKGGAVRIDGEKVAQSDQVISSTAELDGKVLQVGKKKFIRFIL